MKFKILNEADYSSNDVFVDTETGKRYQYRDGKFVEIKQDKNKKGKKGKGSKNDAPDAVNRSQGETTELDDNKPQIGDRPSDDDDILKKEQEEREKEAAEDEYAETEEERAERLAELDRLLNDEETTSTINRETEDQVYKSRKRKSDRERKKQLQQYRAADNLAGFPRSLDNFIKNEVKANTVRTYKKMNKTYNPNSGSSIIRQGKMKRKDDRKPSINVYYDQSGSWGPEDIELGNQAISVLKKYVDKDQITVDIYYFANRVGTTPNGIGGGTYAAPVMDHIKETNPDNVIIMTDWDTTDEKLPKVTVPGGVWFLWKNGQKSEALRNSLHGRKSTQEFNIRAKE